MKLISIFGKFSGYKVNYNKSEAIPLNPMTYSSHLGSAPMQWKPQGMRHLGINIKSPIEEFFYLNGPLLLKTIREDIKRWTVLPISLWGRAEVLKMNILPRLLFLISAIPLKFPFYWFKEMNKLFSDFLWSNKKPRISYKRLSRPSKRGGLGVPDVYSYYLAYNAKFPLLWAYTGQSELGSWKWVEEKILANQDKPFYLTALWYYPKTNLKIVNPLIKCSCEVVKIIQKCLPFNGAYLPSCPIWSNPVLKAGGKTLTNK